MNSFYKQAKFLVWLESFILLLIGFSIAITIIENGQEQPLFYFLFIVYVPVAQFTFTPFFKLVGVYQYYSPMLLGYMANDKQIDLHSGTSFDYFFLFRKVSKGTEWRNRVLAWQIEGLLQLIDQIENKCIPATVNIVGTSYFFNDRTLHKLGFEMQEPSIFYKLNLYLNFIDLLWMYSLSKGQFSFPNLQKTTKAQIKGHDLVLRKQRLLILSECLKKQSTTSGIVLP
jgi:hypothetical protein